MHAECAALLCSNSSGLERMDYLTDPLLRFMSGPTARYFIILKASMTVLMQPKYAMELRSLFKFAW